MSFKEYRKYISNGFEKSGGLLADYSYAFGTYITKLSDKVIPGKRERREMAMRHYVSKLFSGEKLDKRESFRLGFQATGVKSSYTGAAATLVATCITLNPVFLVLSAGFGSLGLVHQAAMRDKIKKAIGSMTEEEKKTLKEHLKDKNVYEMRDTLYELFRF